MGVFPRFVFPKMSKHDLEVYMYVMVQYTKKVNK